MEFLDGAWVCKAGPACLGTAVSLIVAVHLEPSRSSRSAWHAEGQRPCSTCHTSGSSTCWALTPPRLQTGSSLHTSAALQVYRCSGCWAQRGSNGADVWLGPEAPLVDPCCPGFSAHSLPSGLCQGSGLSAYLSPSCCFSSFCSFS